MGRLEDELDRLERETERLARDGRDRPDPERTARLGDLILSIRRGESTDGFDPGEVEEVRATLDRIGPALERTVARLTAKGWGWRSPDGEDGDEPLGEGLS